MDLEAKEGKRREWSEDEDLRLRDLVHSHGVKRWALIATELGGRIGKQCRERWTNHLADDISKEPWSDEEEAILRNAMATFNKRWATIAKMLPGRTENAVKNHWNASLRRDERSRRKHEHAGQSCQRTADEIGCGAAAGASEPASAERKYVARLVPAGLNVVGLGGGGSGLGTDGSSTPHGASSLGYNTPTLNQAAEQLSAQADEPRAPGAPSPPKRGYESAFATGNDGAAGVARGGAKGSRARARFASAAGEAASSGARGGARSVERFAPDSAGARCMPTSALATQALTAEAVRGLRRALNISPAPVQAVGAPAAEGALAVARPGQPRFDGGGTSAQPHSQGAAAELAAMHAAASPWDSYPLLALSNPLLSLATAAMHPGRISPPAAEHALAADAGATDALASHA